MLFVKSSQFSQESPVLKFLLGWGWNEIAGHNACNSIKKRLQHRCFTVNNTKFLIMLVFEEHMHTAASENNNKKIFLGKATNHFDHCMINMGGQRPQIGRNWLLTSFYFQCSQMITLYQMLFWDFPNFE